MEELYYKTQVDEMTMFIIKMPAEMWIPMDMDNYDYRDFLKYLTDNNLTIDDIPVWGS